MSHPINRTKQKGRYRLIGWIGYFSVIFVGMHLGAVSESASGVNVILAALGHLTQKPFAVLPVNWPIVGRAALFGLLAPLLAHTEYLKHRDLRPSEENGSAHWNEDLKRFYKTYAETTVKLPFGLGHIFTFLEKILKKIPIAGKLYSSFYEKLRERFCAPDKSPGSKNMIFTKEVYMSMNTRKTRRNNNILVIGGSGSGKSVTRFCVNQAKHRHSCKKTFCGWRTDNAKDGMTA